MEFEWRTLGPPISLESDLAIRIRVQTKRRDLCSDGPVARSFLFCLFTISLRFLAL